jgi:hypothetical protein
MFVASFLIIGIIQKKTTDQDESTSVSMLAHTPVQQQVIEPTPTHSPRPSESAEEVSPEEKPIPEDLFLIDVKLNQERYQIGDNVIITIGASHACYLILYYIDSQGKVGQIFPHQYATDSRIQEDTFYQIPDQTDPFDFEISGPSGEEELYALCSKIRIETLQTTYHTREEFEQALQDTLHSLPPGHWTKTTISYHITSH